MKKLLPLLLLLLYCPRAWSQCASVSVCTLADGNPTTLLNALNSVTQDNTLIKIPAGTFVWTSRITWTQTFSVTIQGAGNPTGSDSLGNPTGYNDQTILQTNVADTSNNGQMMLITTAAGKSFRMTGITLQTAPGQTNSTFHGLVFFNGNSNRFRFDNNHVNVTLGTEGIVFTGNVQGVMDHNRMDANGVNNNLFEIQGDGYRNLSESAAGDRSWNDFGWYGTANFMFIENNSFSGPSAHAFDCQTGGRGVFRYNSMNDTELQTHGTGQSAPNGFMRTRGCRALEVYGNTAAHGTPNFAFWIQFESGSGRFWNNTVSGVNSMGEVDTIRANNATYSQVAPPNGWGYCGNQVTGVTSVWDQNLSTDGHACFDGVGTGKGDLITGGSTGSFTGTIDSVTGTATWPNQLSEPLYVWGNNVSGLVNSYWFALSSPGTIENRDFYLEQPNFNNPTATFNGTVGIGCGPTSGVGCSNPVARPATCTAGVGYWNAPQQVLYICQAGNFWQASYSPYQYPHPMVSAPSVTGLVNLDNISPSAPGTQLTSTILNNGTFGATWGSSSGTLTAMTVGAHQGNCNLQQPVYVNGNYVDAGMPSQSFAYNNNSNFSWWTMGLPGNSQKMSYTGCMTLGLPATATGSHADDVAIYGSGGSQFAILPQQCPGTAGSGCGNYNATIETKPAGSTLHSSPITLPGPGTYRVAGQVDFSTGTSQMAFYQPTFPFSQIGSTVTGTLPVDTETPAQFRLGNSEVITSNNTTFYENLLFDWTNGTFPLAIGTPAPTPPISGSQGWTYVQESVITYCANNTSSCSNFAGTMIPTRSDTVWIFGISTTNDVTATVSGGGATWTECATCTTFLSGFRRNRVFYAIGGTAGSTGFTINLSGSSGSSFAVTFAELLPPPGSTASFDTGGAASSSTCTGTCTGVPLTLTGTDAVFQFMNRISPADYKSWPSPYLSLPNGDGLHLDALAGAEAAPVVNVQSGSTGAVFSAIAFKSSFGNYTPPASGPITLVSFADPDPASGLTGLNCAPSCNLTVPATGTGHLLYLESSNLNGAFISSVSGGGTWVVPSSCRISGPSMAISCAYVLSSAAPSVSSISITMTGTASTQFAFYELATTAGNTFAFDAVGTASNSPSVNPSGVPLQITGTDAVFQSIQVPGGSSSLSYYPYLRACRSGCGPGFWNGQAASDLIMNVSGNAPTPQWSDQQNNATIVSGIAFSSVPSGGGGGTPTVSLSPVVLNFPNTNALTSSASQNVTLQNTGTAALSITSIAIGGGNATSFSQTNTCGASLAVSASCTISGTFTPQAQGALSGLVVVTSNASTSPDTVSLSGTGTIPVLVSPSSVNLLNQLKGTAGSIPFVVTLTNQGLISLSITSIATSADFGQTNNCGASLGAGLSCQINVTFSPSIIGAESGTLTITDNGIASPQTVSLTGTGVNIVSGSGSIKGNGTIKVLP